MHGRTPMAVFSTRVRIRIEPALRCASAVCRVACLEWIMRMKELRALRHGHGAKSDIFLKYDLQKRLRDGITVMEII